MSARAALAAGLALALAVALALPARAAVTVRAQLDRNRIGAGETAGLDVIVSGASVDREPELALAPGLEVSASSRSQNLSWVNGRSSAETVFHYEIGARRAGRYAFGPVRVQAGGTLYASAPLELQVMPPATSAPGMAWLVTDLQPPEPWVGQPAILRVRVLFAVQWLDSGGYTEPTTSGFWAEPWSSVDQYETGYAGRRVLVNEKRKVLYGLSPGAARVGPAAISMVFESPTGAATPVSLESPPLTVRVRALPPGAPAGFDGAVGTLSVTWSADRARTSQDVPVAVTLDVRGVGNLPLVKPPALAVADADVFAATTDDSLAVRGTIGRAHRRFTWNVLPHRPGPLTIQPPEFSWFDPAAAAYRRAALAPIAVEVGPPVFSARGENESFPGPLQRDVPDPFARGVSPWAWALAGLCAGFAAAAWRARPAADAHGPERARVAAWRSALKSAGGPAFWRAAEESAEWLGGAGRAVGELRAEVAAARYGGREVDADAVRLRLTRELDASLPPPPRRGLGKPVAVGLAAAATAILALSLAGQGGGAGALRLRAADQAARDGDAARARGAWLAMWNEGARAPALAARLAWAEATAGAPARAAVWVLRGERWGARDPALRWVSDRVRESGGLAGAVPVRLPVRRGEWAVLGLLLGVAAGLAWPRRLAAAALVVAALAAAAAEPAQDAWAAHVAQAVVARPTPLEGSGLGLETGQVVRILDEQGELDRVRAGRDIAGRVPRSALLPVEDR